MARKTVPDRKPAAGSRVTVFEAVNSTLKEFFIGTTTLTMNVGIARHQDTQPPEISHWKATQDINYRSVEFGLSAEDAEKFIAGYVRTLPRGWKVIKRSS